MLKTLVCIAMGGMLCLAMSQPIQKVHAAGLGDNCKYDILIKSPSVYQGAELQRLSDQDLALYVSGFIDGLWASQFLGASVECGTAINRCIAGRYTSLAPGEMVWW